MLEPHGASEVNESQETLDEATVIFMMTADGQFDNCLQPPGAHSNFDFDRPAFSQPHSCGNSVALQHVVKPGGSLLTVPSSHSLLQSQGQRYQNPNIMGVGVIRERPNSTTVASALSVCLKSKARRANRFVRPAVTLKMNSSCESESRLTSKSNDLGVGGPSVRKGFAPLAFFEDTSVMASRKELQYQHRQYLKSPEWHDLREQVLERDGWKCVICEFDGRLDGHHVRYPENPYECPGYFVVALCRECHDEVHYDGAHKDNLMLMSLKLEAAYLRECILHLEDRLKDVDGKADVILDVILDRADKFIKELNAKTP